MVLASLVTFGVGGWIWAIMWTVSVMGVSKVDRDPELYEVVTVVKKEKKKVEFTKQTIEEDWEKRTR